MKIGQLSTKTHCKIETIRYYERIGLLPAPARTDGGYRIYSDSHLRRLTFIRRSRELGFTIEEIRTLLDLVDGGIYTCKDIQTITMQHVESVRRKITDLKKLETTLSTIASQCAGNATPECPIIDALFVSPD
ncbi:MAG: helix-turn-helix domain-containing protein [Gammaproteobacteria bacterium]|nr:helix-turn-helix domain-containing protein [Gammaproteobacteria bacterium]MDH5802581.1 helix-turn-helix domain-containing protein [Gammaproteobacteria bacterium]